MTIIRNIIVAFSLYSRIPMPIFTWKENDTKYAISFIPLVGAVIGAVEYGVLYLMLKLGLPVWAEVFMWAGIPLLITGGFHVDGFMDTMDALKSYKPKEEKLAILKDPHIGAFAVISFATYGCFYLPFSYLLIDSLNYFCILCACIGFALIRAIGAYLSLVLKLAKNDGMLHTETKDTNAVSKWILIVCMVILSALLAYFDVIVAGALLAILFAFVFWFRSKMYREFGGITGDTIGYFITVGELIVVIAAAVLACAGL